MLQGLKNWWNRNKIREENLMAELKRYHDALDENRQQLQTVQVELAETKDEVGLYRVKQAADQARRDGTEPWVEIKGADYSDVKGINIELDWNAAFIQYLKDNGIKARDEEAIVQKWLMYLYQDLIEKLEQTVINKSDIPRVNDFE